MSPWSQTGGMSSVQRLECKPRSGPSFGVMQRLVGGSHASDTPINSEAGSPSDHPPRFGEAQRSSVCAA